MEMQHARTLNAFEPFEEVGERFGQLMVARACPKTLQNERL